MKHGAILGLSLTLSACGGSEQRPANLAPTSSGPAATAEPSMSGAQARAKERAAVGRTTFNRSAVHLNLPLYWSMDKNNDGAIEPDETALLLFYPTSGDSKWVDGGAFTTQFEEAYKHIVDDATGAAPAASLSPQEKERRRLVVQDLDQGRATLVANDLGALGADDKTFVKHVLAASSLVDALYATQTGARGLQSRVPGDDPASMSLFRRD